MVNNKTVQKNCTVEEEKLVQENYLSVLVKASRNPSQTFDPHSHPPRTTILKLHQTTLKPSLGGCKQSSHKPTAEEPGIWQALKLGDITDKGKGTEQGPPLALWLLCSIVQKVLALLHSLWSQRLTRPAAEGDSFSTATRFPTSTPSFS